MVIEELKQSEALLEGHFLLSSGTVRILQELDALAVTVAVTGGGEQEMAFQQGF